MVSPEEDEHLIAYLEELVPVTWGDVLGSVNDGIISQKVWVTTDPPVFSGPATVEDGWAAGEGWWKITILEGEYEGKELWLCEGYDCFGDSPLNCNHGIYLGHSDSDGFLFNPDPTVPVEDHQTEVGGSYVKEFHDVEFAIWKPLGSGDKMTEDQRLMKEELIAQLGFEERDFTEIDGQVLVDVLGPAGPVDTCRLPIETVVEDLENAEVLTVRLPAQIAAEEKRRAELAHIEEQREAKEELIECFDYTEDDFERLEDGQFTVWLRGGGLETEWDEWDPVELLKWHRRQEYEEAMMGEDPGESSSDTFIVIIFCLMLLLIAVWMISNRS